MTGGGREVKGLEIVPAEVTSDGEIVTTLEMHTSEGESQFVGVMPVGKPVHTVPDFGNGPYKDKTGY